MNGQEVHSQFRSGPIPNDYLGVNYVSMGLDTSGAGELSHNAFHASSPGSVSGEDEIPRIYEQSAESDEGYSDLNLISDQYDTLNILGMNSRLSSLDLHSSTQQPSMFPFNTSPTSPSFTPTSPFDNSSPAVSDLSSPRQPQQQQQQPPPSPNRGYFQQPTSAPQPANSSLPSLDTSNLKALDNFLSADHSPGHSHSPSLSANSDTWETNSQLSYNGSQNGDSHLSSPQENGVAGGPVGPGGPPKRAASEGKNYRRNIEKKSRDKKTAAYLVLKKHLEDISHRSYGQRCQAEVLEGATTLLVHSANENNRLHKENQILKQKLQQLQQMQAHFQMQNPGQMGGGYS